MKKGNVVLSVIISIVIILAIANVSARTYFSQPEAYYNLGDLIEVQANVDPLLEGFLKVDLICDGKEVNVFNGIPDGEGNVNIKFPLTFSYIQENSGNCYFRGDYFGSTDKSNNFEISKALKVNLDVETIVVKPSEIVTISGTAKRLNGIGINGEVEIEIPLLKLMATDVSSIKENTSASSKSNSTQDNQTNTQSQQEETPQAESKAGTFSGKVENGIFSISFKLSENTPAGEYRIDVLAGERDSMQRITSEGFAMSNLKVLQVPKEIDIAINAQNMDPGTSLEFKPRITDQSGQVFKEEVSTIISDISAVRIFQKIVQSEETVTYNIPTNMTAGYYDITASLGDITANKKFYVNEKAIVSFEIKNTTLVVTSIGNIPYNKDIQVELNGKPFVEKVNLDPGKFQEFSLKGNGIFDIKVSDKETELSQSGIALTGRAVDVKPVEENTKTFNTPILWIFIIIFLAAGLLFIFRNILKKKSFAYPLAQKLKNTFKLKGNTKDLIVPESKKDKYNIIPPPKRISSSQTPQIQGAESALVIEGNKQKIVLLAIKIKNQLTPSSSGSLDKIITAITESKGSIYKKGEYIFGIFSASLTKSAKNEVIAAKSSAVIKDRIRNHNKKFLDKIEFGIAIHSGESINKIENGHLRFTALGTLIPSAKRLAETSNEEVLITKEAYTAAGNEIKVEKKGEVYEIKSILESEKNEKFIKGFLSNLEKEEAKQKGFMPGAQNIPRVVKAY
jgi:hypothetical protein